MYKYNKQVTMPDGVTIELMMTFVFNKQLLFHATIPNGIQNNSWYELYKAQE